MKGKPTFRIGKVDTRIYVKGFSGALAYKALYGILIALGAFTAIYLLTGPFPAILSTVPALSIFLVRLSKVQRNLGPEGYQKKKIAKRLPGFVSVRHRLKKLMDAHYLTYK